ncbi:hypothetical protein PWT90_07317 [Aphanocladium album]|nr:hypothetical protein PWT90_07317 [Aphanocladium album]
MAANAPNTVANGGPPAPAGNSKSNIQFGFDSPSVAHSTPQSGAAAPIPIPAGSNAARVPSPAHSPSPIPQPSASGGRPPSMQAGGQMTFGSLGSDGERHMRQGSVPPNPNAIPTQPGAHFRRESTNSLHGDNNRGNYQGGRGRGYNNHHNNYNNQMGYPPNNQFRNGQGRGMPPAFQPQGRGMPYPNSPQPNRSPAPVSSMPNTPNMPPANMHGHMQTPPQYHYPPPMAPQQQQVQYPFPRLYTKSHKKHPHRREQDKVLSDLRRQPGSMVKFHASSLNPPQLSDITEHAGEFDPARVRDLPPKPAGSLTNSEAPSKSNHSAPPVNDPNSNSFDLSPENGGFERLLTMKNQNYGYPPQQVDQYGRPINMGYGYNNVPPYMAGPPQGNAAYGQQYPPAFHQQSASMSRSPSQPERPSSASQPNQPVVVSSGQAQGANAPKGGASTFVMPRKSAAIQIKNAAGEVVDTSSFKTPASPAPQQVRTPPVAASTPTPPPAKPSTPSHGRTDSATPKTAKEIQDELKEKIKRATQQASAAEEPAKAEAPKAAEVPKAEAPKEEAKAAEPAKTEESEEDEMERMIREMEEADARREKEEEEHRQRREAEKAEAKKNEEANRKVNAEEEDRKLREQEREMERLEEERERKRNAGGKSLSVAEALAQGRSGGADGNVESVTDKLADMKIEGDKAGENKEKRAAKPAALNLAPINTKPVEPPQPTPAMQSLKSARFLQVMEQDVYPAGIKSPNPALNAAVAQKGKTFRYDSNFLLQFQKVFTEQPSIEFHQQVKSLIGDGDGNRSATRTPASGNTRQGSRGGSAFPGGPFNAPPGRGGMSGALPGKPGINPIASFHRPGAPFPGAPAMARSGSQRGAGPNSPRQNSRQTRGSRRNDSQAAKTMPLTAGQEVKPIAVTSNGWKPTSVGKSAVANSAVAAGYLDPELVQRKVKAALNKMTPEKFDRIADQILLIASQSKDESDGRTLRQVIQLTFEKATDESHWASMYAKFCKRMLETMSPEVRDERIKDKNGNIVSGGNLFRKYLLNRCQEDFERGWSVNLPEAPKEEEKKDDADAKKNGEAELMSDEYYLAAAAKRRGLGLVQFIGELYKLGMLTERIMHECVHKLVDYKGIPDEAEVESLCKLLRTIGANLDETEKGRPMMDAYFARIQTMIDLPELPSRIKFLLMDIVDLRRAGWRGKTSGLAPPKTLDEIRAEAEAAQAAKAQEAARGNQRGGGRPPVGRGDARTFSAGYNQQTSNQVGMDDLRRLKTSINRTASQNVTLGPTSMFSSRSNSGRRMGPGGSLGRGDDSGMSSRAGTPPTRENSNTFSLLANMDSENPASPPSAAASPALSKAVPDSGKKESE